MLPAGEISTGFSLVVILFVPLDVTSYNSSNANRYDKLSGYIKLDLPKGADKVKGMWMFKLDTKVEKPIPVPIDVKNQY